MALSPNDIRNFEFTTQMRGYNKEEVDEFLDKVAAALEEVKQENLKLSMELDSVKTQLTSLRTFEDTIKSAAIDARRNADTTIEKARREADEIMSRAKTEAEQLVSSKERQLVEINSRIEKAELLKRAYLSKLQDLMSSHLEMARELASQLPEPSSKPVEDDIEVTDSAEVERSGMTTVGSSPSGTQPIQTEEANAAGEIIEVKPPVDESQEPPETEPEKQQEESASADKEPQEQEKPIDPELAQALEQYTSVPETTPEPEGSNSEPPAQQAGTTATGIVETTARAEDVPPEFIVRSETDSDPNATDRVGVDSNDNVPATAQITDAEKLAPPSEPADPVKLAEELDKVAAKFEEEMDKAASK